MSKWVGSVSVLLLLAPCVSVAGPGAGQELLEPMLKDLCDQVAGKRPTDPTSKRDFYCLCPGDRISIRKVRFKSLRDFKLDPVTKKPTVSCGQLAQTPTAQQAQGISKQITDSEIEAPALAPGTPQAAPAGAGAAILNNQ